ncbi:MULTISPECIES: tryptophan permease [Providencia]|uniref:Aromatic amino acid permease n=4 Tax=Providencia alcalifaciens TaxID=126385 RepID=A0AAW9VAI0_9GAMM|nr:MULTISPECIES: tryptophan permease [Providencia]ATG17072.1 tryptophan permease [Providencia alcalifaciens]EEB44002.1 aromatic amino acid transport protein [Providencia alcalifaciens DSM 30120]EKT66828.1 tryptophan-specific transport protein [Providencia alcalifaciens Dmel2]ETT07984.1 tryptophan-specific transport protein [Providencia alcalifaciens F90-2004]EUC95548.1 tryptophan-specific transport protein [Providencia alcalifaciens PAL-2]
MEADVIKPPKRPSILGGSMIIAGTAVGAGMFSIPMVTSGVWFSGSVVLLIYTFICMLLSGLMILEANMNYPAGASFHTMVKDLLGSSWNTINSLSITFVLYILTYAYISAGSSIITENVSKYAQVPQAISGLVFALVIAFFVWLSTRAVDRLSTILIGGMVITFVMSIGGMVTTASPMVLFDQYDNNNSEYLPYALAALPYLLTSFGYHGNVPGLVKYYNKDSRSVMLSLVYGAGITVTIYILWQYAIQGNIPRSSFIEIRENGNNIGALLNQMNISAQSSFISQFLTLFSYMALASSFLGVSLGLFDFIADFFKFNDSHQGRFKSVIITFLPPTILGLVFPNGFIYAIGFAGLAATIWAVIIPALMARASRKRFPNNSYRTPGGSFVIGFVILFGLINATAHILSLLGLLPVY